LRQFLHCAAAGARLDSRKQQHDQSNCAFHMILLILSKQCWRIIPDLQRPTGPSDAC
jgi:hypothetical protein